MNREKELPQRKLTRLKNADYNRNGAVFLTVCTKDRRCILSRIVGTGVRSLRCKIQFRRGSFQPSSGFAIRTAERIFGNIDRTIISFAIGKITRSICGISMKIQFVDNMTNCILIHKKEKRTDFFVFLFYRIFVFFFAFFDFLRNMHIIIYKKRACGGIFSCCRRIF